MQQIQDIFDRIQKMKKEKKELRGAYKDTLAASGPYKDIVEETKTLREKKKKMEFSVREDMRKEFERLEALEIDLASEAELLNDAAMTQLMKGETVAVTDQYQNTYEPVFSVRFKKSG